MKAQKDPPGEQKFCKSKRIHDMERTRGWAREREHEWLKLAVVSNEDDAQSRAVHLTDVSETWPLRVGAREDGESQLFPSPITTPTKTRGFLPVSFRI